MSARSKSKSWRRSAISKTKGLTAEEVAAIVGKSRVSVQPRTSELEAEGRIRPSGKVRENGSSGREAIVWVVAPDGAVAPKPRAPRGTLLKLLEEARAVIGRPAVIEMGPAASDLLGRIDAALK